LNYFYTSAIQYGSKILLRGYKDGVQFKRKVDFLPKLYISGGRGETEWHTLDGKPVYEVEPGGIRDCKDFVEKYKDVEGFNVYGNTNYAYQFISETWTKEVKFDKDLIRIFSLDIETATENGFPNIRQANEELLLITLQDNKTKNIRTYGTRQYESKRKGVLYIQCADEFSMLTRFLKDWEMLAPDIVTGWNIQFFDMPYLANRIVRILGEDALKRLSPWGSVRQREIFVKGNEEQAVDIDGIAVLDYIDLYKKFTYTKQENYRLDTIAEIELGERKLKNPGENFKDFYNNYWQTFVEYNIKDVELVDKLEDKMRLIELAIVMAFNAKVNFDDVFSQVRMWDTLIYNYLKSKKIVIPNKKHNNKTESIEGAYVKDPLIGFHNWIVSFDLNSLYPHLIMQYNMSPETLLTGSEYVYPSKVEYYLDRNKKPEVGEGHCVAANGTCYRKDVLGFLPGLMRKMYDDRTKYKKQMLKIQQEYENNKDAQLLKEISRLNNLQMAMKISLNSAYGAMANQYFRYYDERIAEGITISGQLSIRWIHDRMNEYLNKLLKTDNADYIIAVDTDSIYITFEQLVNKAFGDEQSNTKKIVKFLDKICEEKIQPYIDEMYQELSDRQNAYAQMMLMKRESIADKGFWTAKKRYVLNVHNSEGVQYAEPKLKVMGLEMIKSSTPAVVRDKLKDTVKVILKGNKKALQEYIEDYRKEFNTFEPEAIAFPRGVNGLREYADSVTIVKKGTPINTRAALLYNHLIDKLNLNAKYEKIKEGEGIKFIYLKEPNPLRQNVMGFLRELPKEFDIQQYIDYDIQFEKVYLDAVSNMIESIGWSVSDQSTLEDFFA
jgi:DNA polymerase elongation subunit (family B)